jgi:hypothetical protein
MANSNRWRIPASVALIIGVVLATGGFDCGGKVPEQTVGSISVSSGFGPVTSPPYQCTGSGNITITPQGLTGTAGTSTTQTKPFTYSGSSNSSPPACEHSELFNSIRFGTWSVTNGGGTCLATVAAGPMAVVKIWNNVCQ